MFEAPVINYKYTSNSYIATKWLNQLPDLIACDFETANKFTDAEKKLISYRQQTTTDKELYLKYSQQLKADGLSHPSLSCITHLSVAWTREDAFVIITDTEAIRHVVYNWLVTTSVKQIWHNTGFDFKHILYNTGLIPKNYDDSQLLAKSLLNHANNFKSKSGLKELMGWKYGDWAINSKEFTLDNLHNQEMIRYAAIDAIATFNLYEDIIGDLQGE